MTRMSRLRTGPENHTLLSDEPTWKMGRWRRRDPSRAGHTLRMPAGQPRPFRLAGLPRWQTAAKWAATLAHAQRCHGPDRLPLIVAQALLRYVFVGVSYARDPSYRQFRVQELSFANSATRAIKVSSTP